MQNYLLKDEIAKLHDSLAHKSSTSRLPMVFLLLGLVAILLVTRQIHYLLFHTLAEFVAITVSFSLFTLAWACRKQIRNGYLIILGAAYGSIGLIDILHTLTFEGLNIFPEMTLNHPTQFWLVARGMEAVALLVAPLYARNTLISRRRP